MIERIHTFYKDREFWSLENRHLIPSSGPILIACEHPPFPGLFPFLKELKKIRPDTVVISDALLSPVVEKFIGFKSIPVNAPHNFSLAKSPNERTKMKKVRRLGEMLGMYKNDGSQGASQVVNSAYSELEAKKAVVIAPAGQNSKEARWKSGFGSLVKRALSESLEMNIALVEIDRSHLCTPSVLAVLHTIQLDSVGIAINPNDTPRSVSNTFQQYFEYLKISQSKQQI